MNKKTTFFVVFFNIFTIFKIQYSMNTIIINISRTFASCPWLLVLIVALCPLLESKISLPLALNVALWGNASLSNFSAFVISFVGSSLPCYFVVILIKALKKKTTGFVSSKLTTKYSSKINKINDSNSFKKYLALCCFSALPLPLTGVWSSSVIAGLTNLKTPFACIAIIIGNLISCLIMFALCCYFENSIDNILLISISILIVCLIINFVASLFKRKTTKT